MSRNTTVVASRSTKPDPESPEPAVVVEAAAEAGAVEAMAEVEVLAAVVAAAETPVVTTAVGIEPRSVFQSDARHIPVFFDPGAIVFSVRSLGFLVYRRESPGSRRIRNCASREVL